MAVNVETMSRTMTSKGGIIVKRMLQIRWVDKKYMKEWKETVKISLILSASMDVISRMKGRMMVKMEVIIFWWGNNAKWEDENMMHIISSGKED